MPYAANGQISTAPIDGGLEITEQQYAAALAGMGVGRIITIEAGELIISDPPQPELPKTEQPAWDQAVPRQVSRLQGILALDAVGLLDAVETIVARPDTPRQIRLSWLHALMFERTSLALAWIAEQAEITAQQLDELFIAGSQIQA